MKFQFNYQLRAISLIHHRGTEITEFIRFFNQSGDDDWIKDTIPSGINLRFSLLNALYPLLIRVR